MVKPFNFLVDNKPSHPVEIIAQFLTHRVTSTPSLALKSHLPVPIPSLLFSSSSHTQKQKHPPNSSLQPSQLQSPPAQPNHQTLTTNHIRMSAIAKPVTILAGLLVAGTATTYTVRSKNSDFSAASLAASDMDAAASAAGVSKPKL
jgi:hypothetical protein